MIVVDQPTAIESEVTDREVAGMVTAQPVVPEIPPAAKPPSAPSAAPDDSGADGRQPTPPARDEAVEALAGRLATVEGRLADVAGLLDSTDNQLAISARTATGADQRIAELGARLTSVDSRLDGIGDQLTAVQQRLAGHDAALLGIGQVIAVEVEKQTTDALAESQHSLQLAVNSIARLALAMAESTGDITADISAESATALLDSFRVDLDAVLAQLGFVSLETSAGAAFDPHRHRALKRVSTIDRAKDKLITRVIRDGYRSAGTGRILLFADVEVSRYQS